VTSLVGKAGNSPVDQGAKHAFAINGFLTNEDKLSKITDYKHTTFFVRHVGGEKRYNQSVRECKPALTLIATALCDDRWV